MRPALRTLALLAALLGAVAAAQGEDPTAPRKAEALRLFGRLDDDRALTFVASGPPDARTPIACPGVFREIEVWTWLEHPTLGKSAQAVFYAEPGTGVYRYWTLVDGETVLLAAKTAEKVPLADVDPEATGCLDAFLVKAAVRNVAARQKDNNGGLAERGVILAPPEKPDSATATAAAAPPAPVLVSNKPLSGRERSRLLKELPERYRRFLEDVEPILADLERDTFLRLASDYQRDRFVEEFWKRRSVGADGFRVPFQDIYESRLRFVRERYRNVNTDMARVYLVNGPPDGLRKYDCQDVFWPIQVWYYERLESLRMSKVPLLFYQPFGTGDYKLWTSLDGYGALLVGWIGGGMAGSAVNRQVDITRCIEWREINAAVNAVAAIFGTTTALKFSSEVKEGPKPDVEGVDRILQMTTDLPAGAEKLPIQRVLRFPEMVANKMRLELTLILERQGLGTKPMGEETFYDLDVVGEVIKGGRLVENFRYRFDFPASTVAGPFVPLLVERELYPGEYQLRVKVADANRNAAALLDEKLVVPESPDAVLSPEEKAAREAARAAVARLVADPKLGKGSISLVPLAREYATGLVRFETRSSSTDIAFVEFYLNGRKIATKRRPPFDVDLDLGELPRKQSVRVVAYDKDGRALSEDQMILNEGREAFRVRIVSPEKGVNLEGPVRVVADLAVPETKKLQKLEFFVNDARAATLFQQPWQQVVDVPRSKDLGFLRVVATLEDGATTEDLVYYNAPKYLSEVSVQAVELYTSVFSKGRPVVGLPRESFTVLEDGQPQVVDGFEVVTNLPLSLGIGLDTSGSMEEELVEAQKAATEFLRRVMTKRDRCFFVSFDTEPQLVTRFTTDRDKLAQALASTRAQGSTALWDALVYGLYQYQGVRGRKAYVVLTDGEDRSSKFTYEAAVDYARKSGVAIYFIGLRIGPTQVDIRSKLNRISRETGGAVYYIDSARNLDAIYKEIDEELRSQYLLTYVPSAKPTPGGKWRKVEVKVNPGDLVARTISGYYP